MNKYVIGIDFGTLSARAGLFDIQSGTELAAASENYPHGVMDTALLDGEALEADFALQHPADYIEVLSKTVKEIIRISGVGTDEIAGIGIDFTSCTCLPTYADGTPLCYSNEHSRDPHAYAKLWKHHGAQPEADRITEIAKKEGMLESYGGKVSSEWLFPKLLETANKSESIFNDMAYFVEAGDWLTWQLTGKKVRSACMAGYKAFWSEDKGYPENEFFKKLDSRLDGIVGTKISGDVAAPGSLAGTLTKQAAEMTGLAEGTAVSVPIIDAHASIPALGITEPGKMVLIMGTSSCHIVLSEKLISVPGISGVVKNGIIEGYYAYEAGQAAVGDIFDWYVKNCVPKAYYDEAEALRVNIHKLLREKAKKLNVGESKLVALDWWNGNRCPLADSGLSGVIAGMTLATGPEHIYRALLEATAYGTKVITDGFVQNGVAINEIYAAGGIPAKDDLIMQIYADVLNIPIKVSKKPLSPALGSAVLSAVASGCYDDIKTAAEHMTCTETTVYNPIEENAEKYKELFERYMELYNYFGNENLQFMKKLKG